jgi:hypothetical protein
MYGRCNSKIWLLEVPTNFVLLVKMSATMTRHEDWVQLEESDLHNVLKMAKMSWERLSSTATEEENFLINKHRTKHQEEKKLGLRFPRNWNMQAVMEWHPAMVHDNRPVSCLRCQNGQYMNLQTHWRHKCMGVPPAELEPPPPRMPSMPTGDNDWGDKFDAAGVLFGYV